MFTNESTTPSNFPQWARALALVSPDIKEAIIKIAQEGKAQNLVEEYIKQIIDECCDLNGLSRSEAFVALEEFQNKNAINPFNSPKIEDGAINWNIVAKNFLGFLQRTTREILICLNDEYYVRRGSRYKKIADSELRAKVCQYISATSNLRFKKISVATNEILAALNGLILIPNEFNMPFYNSYISQGIKYDAKKVNWVSLENGIIKIDKVLETNEVALFPHDPNFITQSQLPYPYTPDADCPKFLKFLSEAIGDQERIEFIQEWFGYHLTPHCDYHKFVILIGQGANGKSVLLKALSLLIGEGNYVSISLECLDPTRTFTIASLAGKMANIINDMNEVDKTSEGMLKQLVAGEPLTVENKHKPPFVMRSTAKFSMATNVEPKFYDRTDGIWRRAFLLRFENQILEENKQDKNLMNDNWWLQSGELPGIFNWALEGLVRLEKRKCFIVPKKVENDVKDFRENSNAAATFLKIMVIEDTEKSCPASWLFRDYKNYCSENNYKALSSQNFAKEVRRAFPQIELSSDTKLHHYPIVLEKNFYNPIVSRAWLGIRYIKYEE